MSATTTYPEVAEGIRATIAAYAQALDDGRTGDIIATFCPDGICEMPGMGTYVGHDALREAFSGWKPRAPQRHLVLNTLITAWNDNEATSISDIVFIAQGDAGWAIQLVGRYHDTFHNDAGTWRIHQRTAEFLT